jgi:beta-lactamase superfamily II metal-dependent hydrolase
VRRLVVGFLLMLAICCAATAADLVVYFLDVDHGDAILVDYGTYEVLIDAGYKKHWGSLSRHWELLDAVVDGPVDVFAMSHADLDHYSAFELIFGGANPRYELGAFWHAPDTAATTKAVELLSFLSYGLTPQIVAAADVAGGGATIGEMAVGEITWTALHPTEAFASAESEKNENSLVLLLTFGDVRFLFTGDIEREAEDALETIPLPAGPLVLKVSHHGSTSSTSTDFLSWADPELAIVGGDADDLSFTVSSRLERRDIPTFVTGIHGTVTVTTDGTTIWVTTETLGGAAGSGE